MKHEQEDRRQSREETTITKAYIKIPSEYRQQVKGGRS